MEIRSKFNKGDIVISVINKRPTALLILRVTSYEYRTGFYYACVEYDTIKDNLIPDGTRYEDIDNKFIRIINEYSLFTSISEMVENVEKEKDIIKDYISGKVWSEQ